MSYYAAMICLQEKRVVVVGGGRVAERKIVSLLDSKANINVISPSLTPNLLELASSQKIIWRKKMFEPIDLAGAFLVIAATNERMVNREVVKACRPNQIVNNVSDPRLGNMIRPAVFQQGDLQIAVSTGGSSPVLAKKIRDQLRIFMDENRFHLD